MMQCLRQWFQRLRLRKRELFRFYDGERTRWADPFLTYRRFTAMPNLDDLAACVDEGKEPETTEYIKHLCGVFGVSLWDGQRGLTDWEVLDLGSQFLLYLDGLKKNTSLGPNSPESTASASSVG